MAQRPSSNRRPERSPPRWLHPVSTSALRGQLSELNTVSASPAPARMRQPRQCRRVRRVDDLGVQRFGFLVDPLDR